MPWQGRFLEGQLLAINEALPSPRMVVSMHEPLMLSQ